MRDHRLGLVLAAAVPLGLLAALPGCGGGGPDGTWPDRPGPKVVVSFAPLYSFAVNVAGDDAVVKNVMTTDGPHDFNPTDTDARLLRRADLFLINGLKLDNDLAAKLQKNSGNAALKVVDLGSRIPARQLLVADHDHDDEHHHDHHHHDHDPHVWLGPDQAVFLVEGIRDALKEADPAHADGYTQRAAAYVDTLRKLKADGLELLKGKQDRKLVTFHESLGYFGEAFKLRIVGSVQKKPGVEPNAEELSDLLKVCRGGNVRLIAVEPQYTAHTSAKTVLDELRRNGVPDAELVEIDPLETVRPDGLTAGWYESRMRANLQSLAAKMK